jgi:uncharacterized protein YbjT (DUF2867 family)
MRLTVLGATGRVGRHIVTQALADGHQVVAAVRDPGRLGLTHDRLTVRRADALDAASVKTVIQNADAVLSGVGPTRRRDPLNPASASARAAVEAMDAVGVRRILMISAEPVNRAGTGEPWATRRLVAPLLWRLMPELYADLELMERVLRESGLDWTAVRPPRLLDGAGQGRYRHAVEASGGSGVIARADVARAMLDFVTDTATIGHAVGVSR